MSLKIPATSIRTKFLKSLPLGTCYLDSKTKYVYEVIEKKLNNNFVKSAVPYLGKDKEPIELEFRLNTISNLTL